jgi:hypothetical protein
MLTRPVQREQQALGDTTDRGKYGVLHVLYRHKLRLRFSDQPETATPARHGLDSTTAGELQHCTTIEQSSSETWLADS